MARWRPNVMHTLENEMNIIRILALLVIISIGFRSFGQDYKKYQSKTRHSSEVISIATTESRFATGSDDKTVNVWDYDGNIIYKYKIAEGQINSLAFIPSSNSLLVGITETHHGNLQRYIIRCLSPSGKNRIRADRQQAYSGAGNFIV